ncbi:MAG: hypothetical protein FD155_1805 [Bacteroidetes bacterium]|nr:MAG: hypothetical protein FD155_1805 [Bacteroidota bacterium]
MLVEAERLQSAAWFTVIVMVDPHAAVSVIEPLRAMPLLAITETDILPLFEPDVGVTVTQDKDSETVQEVFEVMFAV